MVNEASMEHGPEGSRPTGDGWFVVNTREAAWMHNDKFGAGVTFEGASEFAHYGINVQVLWPGQPNGYYHREGAQEDFLVLSGECLLLVEDQERHLRAWDFVHCPREVAHIFVGAGEGPCVILAASSRQFQKDGPWGSYCVDETAARYNASPPENTQDVELAYARVPPSRPARYRQGLLPGDEPNAARSTTSWTGSGAAAPFS